MSTEGGTGPTSLDKTAEQLADQIGLTDEEIAWRKEFVDFDTEDQERMARLGDIVSAEKEQLTEAFLEAIYAHDQTREIVDQAPQGKDGLRRVVEQYLETLTGGTYDTEYYTQRCRIGRIHDQLDLPLHHFGGMFGNLTTLFLEEIKASTIETARNAAESDGPDAVEAAIEEGFADAMAATRCINLDMQVVNDTYESRRRELREAINLIPDPVFETNQEGRLLLVNDATAELFDCDPKDLIGKTPDEVGATEVELWNLQQEAQAAIESGEPQHDVEKRLTTANGETRTFEVSQMPHRVGVTNQFSVLVHARDITDQKEHKAELKRTRELIETTQENASIGWWEVNLVEDTLHWSDEVYRIHDLSVDQEVKLEDGIDFYHPEDRPTIRQALEKLWTEGEPYDLELRIITAEDRVRWIRTVADPLYGDDGEIVSILGIFQDITERKDREEKLRQFREAVEATAHAVYITDSDGTIEYVNSAFEAITGFSSDEAIGRSTRLLNSGEHDPDFYEEFWETLESGERWESEMIDRRADGEKIVLNQTIAPITDEDGVPQKYVAVAQDITSRKQYEKELEETREELRQIIDLVPDLVFAKNRDGEYLLANKATADAYGLTPQEVEGRRGADIVPNSTESEKFRADDLEVIRSGEPKEDHEEELTTADGKTKILQTTKIPYEVPGSGEDAVLGYARDVTELKEYENRLEEERDFLDSIIESLPFPFYVIDVEDYTVEYANSNAEVSEGSTCHAITHRRDQPCDEGDDPIDCPLSTVLETGDATVVEHVHYDETGNERTYQVHASPIFDENGDIALMAESNVDITERVQYEQQIEQQRDNLQLLNKIVRHDVRNDLQLVLAYAETLEEYVEEDGEEYIRQVLEAARGAVDVTTTARDVTEVMLQQNAERSPIGLRRVLESEINGIRSSNEKAIVAVEDSIPHVKVLADDMLESVFRNLLSNAIVHNDAEVAEITVAVQVSGDVAQIRIADNGPGIPNDQKERIFEEGKTGLDSGGTGLGLYLVETLIDRYKGDVWVEDNTPSGSVFVVELPIADS